jgi:SAM-dependent methyltransferase
MIYERLSDYYDQFIDDDLINLYLNLIQSEIDNGSVMALGCGTGPLAVELARNSYNVSGSDISPYMLEKAYNNAVSNNVHIQLYIHDVLDPLVQTFDIITMVSDVINYIQEEQKVSKVFHNVSDAMSPDSIFVFDFLRPSFLKKMHNHHEDILLKDDVLEWTVSKTNVLDQVKHVVRLGEDTEVHYERTFPLKTYKELLNENDLYIVKKRKTPERTILLCKKK